MAIVEYFVLQGVPHETVILLLMLPMVATMVAFFQQVIGLKAFGIYTPTIIAFAIFDMGFKYGVAAFISVIAIGMLVRYFIKKLRILYLPRVAITITVVAFSVLIILLVSGYVNRTGVAAISILPLLIMIAIVEKFVAAQIEKGGKKALKLAGITLIISIAGYGLLKWNFLETVVTDYPWIILLTIPFNIFLGKWTGLRISEYFRFREIFKRMS